MSNYYQIGDLVRCTGEFTNRFGVYIDPTTVYAKWKTPNDVTTTYQYGVDAQVVRDSQGIYYFEINVTELGIYYYSFYSTGTGQAAEEAFFTVPVTNFNC